MWGAAARAQSSCRTDICLNDLAHAHARARSAATMGAEDQLRSVNTLSSVWTGPKLGG